MKKKMQINKKKEERRGTQEKMSKVEKTQDRTMRKNR